MSSALTPIANGSVTPEQVELIKRTVANGATADELKLYLYDCQRRGVHPLDRLIHFTKRGGKYTPITGIDFMRTRAHESGACAGIADPVFSGDPGSPDFSAFVVVKRIVAGIVADFTATARWSEYFPGEQSGMMWRKMPHTMLGKCAEALALRKGFPQELAGLYAKEEMEQAGPVSMAIVDDDPDAGAAAPTRTAVSPRKATKPPAEAAMAPAETQPQQASDRPLDVARGRFYTVLGQYGLGKWTTTEVLKWISSTLQADLSNLFDLNVDQWHAAADGLARQYGAPPVGKPGELI